MSYEVEGGRGRSENNLKNLDVDIPRNELVVLTGLILSVMMV